MNQSVNVCVMAYQPLRLQTPESMVTRNPFQHFKHHFSYSIQVLHHNAISAHAVLLKLILEAHEAKIGSAITKILLQVNSGMTVSVTEQ